MLNRFVALLRQIEVATAQGKSISIASREAGISEQSYFRWRKEYGGLDLDQACKMKDLEKENARLKRLVADLSLEKRTLVAPILTKILHQDCLKWPNLTHEPSL